MHGEFRCIHSRGEIFATRIFVYGLESAAGRMTFEWDAYKEEHNIGKHNGITFRTAANVFAGEHAA